MRKRRKMLCYADAVLCRPGLDAEADDAEDDAARKDEMRQRTKNRDANTNGDADGGMDSMREIGLQDRAMPSISIHALPRKFSCLVLFIHRAQWCAHCMVLVGRRGEYLAPCGYRGYNAKNERRKAEKKDVQLALVELASLV